MCEIYWETFNTVSVLPTVGNSPKFWKVGDQKKLSAWGDLKSSFHRYFPGGPYCVSCEIKYGLEYLISNVDLDLLQLSNNQLMFSFVSGGSKGKITWLKWVIYYYYYFVIIIIIITAISSIIFIIIIIIAIIIIIIIIVVITFIIILSFLFCLY